MTNWIRRLSGLQGNAAREKRGAAKRKSVNPLVALQGLAEAHFGDESHVGMARDGYLTNPVVHRCVRMIVEAAASMPWLAYENGFELETHPLLGLLARPNPLRAGNAFMEAVYGSLVISGNAYLHAIRIDGVPRELHLLRADRVSVERDDSGWPVAYLHTVNGNRQRFEAEDGLILHLAMYNPLDPFDGAAPMAAARMALGIHNAATRWNKALLDNSARPSGALVYASAQDMNLTEEQFERLKGELEDGYTGAGRAGRPMLLEGGLDWKPMGYSPKDMDFMEARNGAAREIALAFGVPPMLLGIPGDNTYANFQEANRAFWRQTVMPLAGRVAGELEAWLCPAFGDGLTLDLDRDAVEALAADRDALWKRISEADFLTDDEKRQAAGYGKRVDDESYDDARNAVAKPRGPSSAV